MTAYSELCQIFALLQVRSDRTAGPQAPPGRPKRCEELEIGPIGPLGGRTPGGLLVLGRSQTGLDVLFLTYGVVTPGWPNTFWRIM